MNRRERLMATLRGEPVDRPAVNFYEIGGFPIDPGDGDEFNVYNAPSWKPLLDLAEEHTDLIRMRAPVLTPAFPECRDRFFKRETYRRGDSRFTRTSVTVGKRTLTALSRRDRDLDTVWTVEHLLKDGEDLKAFLELPEEALAMRAEVSSLLAEDRALGDRGIVMADVADPLCEAAMLFSMEDFTVLALTEETLFHRLLEKFAQPIHAWVESAARDFPGQLWRIYGAEFATAPFLPPRLFNDYVKRYTGPMAARIKAHGGYARIHCHGRIASVLPCILEMGADAIDPIEPPPQGDVELKDVVRDFGRELVLFGNIEMSDIENMPPHEFEGLVKSTIRDGTAGAGRGFVLMPSASPYGRSITQRTMANYETMVRQVKGLSS